MPLGHNKGTELPTLRERLLARRSDDAFIGASMLFNPDGPEADAMLQTAAEALTKCRDKFREYEKMHTQKLADYDGKKSLNYAANLQFEIDRNREMADFCSATLERLKR